MMNPSDIQPFLKLAEEALHPFLATLFQEEASIVFREPKACRQDEVTVGEAVVATSPTGRFAVCLDHARVALLASKALKKPSAEGEATDGFLAEMVDQGYRALRQLFATAGVDLPEEDLAILPQGTALAETGLPGGLVMVPFSLKVGGQSVDGFVLLPEPLIEDLGPILNRMTAAAPSTSGRRDMARASFPDLGHEVISGDGGMDNFELLAEVELEVTVELGRRRMPLADVLRLTNGSVIELEKLVGEPLEVYANGRMIAEGEAVVIDDQFGIRITRLASVRQRTRAVL